MIRHAYSAVCLTAMAIGSWAWVPAVMGEAHRPIEPPSTDPLLQTIELAKRGAPVIPAGRIASAKAELGQAAWQLEQFLARGGMRKVKGWKDYLHWPKLREVLTSTSEPQPEQVEALANRYRTGAPGLTLLPMANMRDALRTYRDALQQRRSADFATTYRQVLDELGQQVNQYDESPSPNLSQEIANRLSWLERLDMADGVVDQVRLRYSQPNLYIRAAERLVVSGFANRVDEPTAVNDVILGTHVIGRGRTQGHLFGGLLPCRQRALIQVELVGQTRTPTTGYNGPVTIRSFSQTGIQGKKLIGLDAAGLTAAPATAVCRTATQIQDIAANRKLGHRIVEKVAWRRAGQQKSMAEQIAAGRAAGRVARMMDERSAGFLAQANQRYWHDLRAPLERRRVLPEFLHFQTTDHALHIAARHALSSQLGAPGLPPMLPAERDDVIVTVHESFVNNAAEAVLGGSTFTDERIVRLLQENQRPIPEELSLAEDKDPWSITFAEQQPFTVQFTPDGVRMAIRGQRFTRGEQELDELMEISANYQMRLRPEGGMQLVRQGEIDVQFPGRETTRLGLRDVSFKTFMQRKFGSLFQEEMDGEGVRLPGRWQNRESLKLRRMSNQHGWLMLAWRS